MLKDDSTPYGTSSLTISKLLVQAQALWRFREPLAIVPVTNNNRLAISFGWPFGWWHRSDPPRWRPPFVQKLPDGGFCTAASLRHVARPMLLHVWSSLFLGFSVLSYPVSSWFIFRKAKAPSVVSPLSSIGCAAAITNQLSIVMERFHGVVNSHPSETRLNIGDAAYLASLLGATTLTMKIEEYKCIRIVCSCLLCSRLPPIFPTYIQSNSFRLLSPTLGRGHSTEARSSNLNKSKTTNITFSGCTNTDPGTKKTTTLFLFNEDYERAALWVTTSRENQLMRSNLLPWSGAINVRKKHRPRKTNGRQN